MNAEFFNKYIEKLGDKIGELTKIQLLNETQIEMLSADVHARDLEIAELKTQLEKTTKRKLKAETSLPED